MITYNGNDVDVKTNPEDEERNQADHDRKAAIKGALSDINNELKPKQ